MNWREMEFREGYQTNTGIVSSHGPELAYLSDISLEKRR